MAKNEVFLPGYYLSVVCSDPTTPASGDPVRLGNLTGIAMTDEGDGITSTETSVYFGPGVFDLSVKGIDGSGNSAVSAGDALWYVDADTPKLSKKTTGYFFGFALEGVLSGATSTIQVLHVPSPGTGNLAAGSIGTTQLAATGVTPAKLSAAANSRSVVIPLGAVSATASFVVFVAPVAGSLSQCLLVTKDAIVANDTNYWTVALVDKGADGSESNTIATKHTKATGGTGFGAYDAWDIGTLDPTHKVLAAGDAVVLTLTKSASATAFAEAAVMLEFLPS
jgi:predicted RecA/RadA family phage recombinase